MAKSKYQPVIVKKNKSKDCGNDQLDKRTYVPFTLVSTCPKCQQTVERDLSDQYLSYPIANAVNEAGMYCCEEPDGCGHEFTVRIMVNLIVEAV